MLAICLSGGGAKGAAHVGALLELEKMGLKFDMVVGSSIGALVGAGYAILGSAKALYEYALKLQKLTFVKKVPSSRSIPSFIECFGANLLPSTLPSFIYFWPLKRFLKDWKFENLKIRFACTAVNIENGELKIFFDEGYILPALKASMAIPGVFKPVKINGKKYMDGGTLENLPILPAKKLGADKIIGLKLLSKKIKYNEIKNAAQAFERIDNIRENIMEGIYKEDNIIIELPTQDFNTLDFTQTEKLIEIGQKTIFENKEYILENLS